MDRFRELMSWDQPKDQGPSTPNEDSMSAEDATPFESPDSESSTLWDSFYGADSSESKFADQGASDDSQGSFTLNGKWAQPSAYRNYFLPVHYTPTYEYPLIVWLHSNGFNENQVDQVMPHISLRNYVGLGVRAGKAADAAGHRFDWQQSPSGISVAHEAIIDSVEEAISRFSINTSRIVLAGYRDGGTMAIRIALRDPDRFAGVISMGGRMPQGGIRNLQQLQERRLPMLWQWGDENPEYTGANFKSDCQSVMTTGSQVEVRQYPGDDEMETVPLREIDDWIMRRVVSTSTSDPKSEWWSTSPTAYSSN